MKVAVFTRSTALGEIEDDINEWLETERLSPEDVLVKQSQSSTEEGTILTISVWYIPRPVEPVERTKSEGFHTCTCGAGVEVDPFNHNEQCNIYCPF